MEVLLDSLVTAIRLILSGDKEVFAITTRTVMISLASTLIAAAIFLPVASLIHFHDFPLKGMVLGLVQTFYSLPTVFVGMLVFIVFSKAGPLGSFGILFSPQAIIIGEVILISPIIVGVANSAMDAIGPEIKDTAVSLGAGATQAMLRIAKEAQFGIATAVLLAFGRAVSEVGLAIIVGGNIRDYTRTLTTAMALETSIGNVELSLALGIILVSLALLVNILVGRLRSKYR
ncbi:MAG: ABC transporter permease [SAR202 cluster bacterium Casp-Chloro-G4]|nr:ABC transporter permease [Chloroflexota bacterium]MDA1228753.1 ABC transporter permease [Chloroflexota bacterium]PKB60927.1 MAG: ABC transporter permease [SAR202 cluster bacterium Casp-Chloro-G4]